MKDKINSQFKIGLVLEGGGVKGAYQAGAMKALDEYGVHFDGIVGTSIGAVNGALYLQGGFDCISDVWQNMEVNTVYDFTDEEVERLYDHKYAPVAIDYFKRLFDGRGNFFDKSYEKTQLYFENIVNEDDIRNSGMDFGCVSYCVSDFSPCEVMVEDVEYGSLIDYVIASATFPIFPAKVIKDKKYIDGGVYDNIPINLLLQKGYENILVIRTNVMEKLPKRKQLRDANIRIIAPKEDLGMPMLFSSTRVKKFMQMGYEDTINALENGLKDFLSGNCEREDSNIEQICKDYIQSCKIQEKLDKEIANAEKVSIMDKIMEIVYSKDKSANKDEVIKDNDDEDIDVNSNKSKVAIDIIGKNRNKVSTKTSKDLENLDKDNSASDSKNIDKVASDVTK